jgi:tyrosine decarboxylase/aspartate 1-decarboxylase
MQTYQQTLGAFQAAAKKLDEGFDSLPRHELNVPGADQLATVLSATAERLHDNYPYFHPLYAGQMLKPPHPVAQLAYSLAMWINPNNHALDGGRATSAMEKEAVAEIAAMFGWTDFLGHLCGGGTMANLEALWVAGQLQPGKKILASEQAHYTHKRISGVLQLECESVPVDSRGRMDVDALKDRLALGDVGAVVATMGTTASGSVDPLPDILALRERYSFRVHADAAYGGYFTLAQNLGDHAKAAFARITEVDSIVIDPHKHGLQPYGCGCVLFHDPRVGRLYWNARGQARRPQRCGRRNVCCRCDVEGNSPGDLSAAGKQRSHCTESFSRVNLSSRAFRPNWTSWCSRRGRPASERFPRCRARFLTRRPPMDCTWHLPSCR